MEHPTEFHKLLRQILSREPKPLMSEEEIHFDQLAMKVMHLVGEKCVVCKGLKTGDSVLCPDGTGVLTPNKLDKLFCLV